VTEHVQECVQREKQTRPMPRRMATGRAPTGVLAGEVDSSMLSVSGSLAA
jgi:hypothetical protein